MDSDSVRNMMFSSVGCQPTNVTSSNDTANQLRADEPLPVLSGKHRNTPHNIIDPSNKLILLSINTFLMKILNAQRLVTTNLSQKEN